MPHSVSWVAMRTYTTILSPSMAHPLPVSNGIRPLSLGGEARRHRLLFTVLCLPPFVLGLLLTVPAYAVDTLQVTPPIQ